MKFVVKLPNGSILDIMPNSKTEALSLKQNTLWNSIGCLFYLGCQWLTTVLVVTLSTGYGNSGILAFAMSAGIIFASIALYKIRTYQVSDLEGQFSSQNYIAFRFITIVGGALFCFLYLLAIGTDSSLLLASMLYLLFKADETFSDVIYGIYQKNERMDYIGKSQLIRGFVSLTAFCTPLVAGASLNIAIISMALCCMCVTLLFDLPHVHLFGSVRPSIKPKSAISLARICLPAMLASLCANAVVSVVRQYFGLTFGDDALGIYAAVATPAVLVQVAATYLYMPAIGALTRAWIHQSERSFHASFTRILTIMVAVIALLIAVLSAFGGPLLQMVYGESIASSIYLFPYVLIATGCIGLLMYIDDVLIVVRDMHWLLACNAIALACSIGSALIYIPLFYMNGINFAIITGAGVGFALGLWRILRTRSQNKAEI